MDVRGTFLNAYSLIASVDTKGLISLRESCAIRDIIGLVLERLEQAENTARVTDDSLNKVIHKLRSKPQSLINYCVSRIN